MHFEEPSHPPSSMRAFARQYAMIVLSIMTALGIEQIAVSLHYRQMAHASRERIERELAADAQDLRRSLGRNESNKAAMKQALQRLLPLVQAAKPDDAKILALVQVAFSGIDIEDATWQRDAWDSAIADQSVSHMERNDIEFYSQVYTQARDSAETLNFLTGGGWVQRITEMEAVDTRLGHVDGTVAAKMMVDYLLAANQIARNETDLLAMLEHRTGSSH